VIGGDHAIAAGTSRAHYNDALPAFLRRLTEPFGYERALPVNTGLETVETALKAARKWGHAVKGIPDGRAEIVACAGNFHGRSIAIVGVIRLAPPPTPSRPAKKPATAPSAR
jgi:ornithine--oxo-acid transaminase